MEFFNLSENSLLITWNSEINSNLTRLISSYKAEILTICKNDIQDCVQSISSILIIIDLNRISISEIVEKIKMIDYKKVNKNDRITKVWEIPVCYDLEYATDINLISDKNNISVREIIDTHLSKTYDVLSMGFLPGFMYLGKTDKKLYCERKEKPSFKIRKGSIGLALDQTCIYPRQSPGGWNIIGITPIELFNINSKNPCFSRPGDKIQFVEISKSEYKSFMNRLDKPKLKEL